MRILDSGYLFGPPVGLHRFEVIVLKALPSTSAHIQRGVSHCEDTRITHSIRFNVYNLILHINCMETR